MASLFTRIIEGDLPGRFIWRDDRCVAFLTIAPMTTGHTLVVPIEEIPHWIDCPADLVAHLMVVARTIGQAQQAVFSPPRIGLIIAGMEVAHTHLHVLPIERESDLHFANARHDVPDTELDDVADKIRGALRNLGHEPPANSRQ